jgi:hypothetical protein
MRQLNFLLIFSFDLQRYRATVDAQLGLLPAAGQSTATAD